MNDVTAALEKAIQAGEVLTVKYHGGSQPGAERQIAPISIDGHKVRARCYTSNAVKQFMIDKIELCTSHVPEGIAAWNPKAKPKVIYTTIADVHQAHRNDFELAGWHVAFENEQLGLHRRRKNGDPLKWPDVSLSYQEWVDSEYDSDVNFIDDEQPVDIFQAPQRKSTRPYRSWAKKHTGSSYAHLDRAVERFLQWAKELAPKI